MARQSPLNDSTCLLRRKLKEVNSLYEISRALASTLNLRVSVKETFRILSRSLGIRWGTLALLDPKSNELVMHVAYGLTAEELSKGRYKPGEGVMGTVIQTGEAQIVEDIRHSKLFLDRTGARSKLGRQAMSFICVPVIFRGEILGALSADRLFKEREVSLEEDVKLLKIVGSLIGQAVVLSQVVREEHEALMNENLRLREQNASEHIAHLAGMVGESQSMKRVCEAINRVGPMKSTVLIRGESGTGKELAAHGIHLASNRRGGPFVRLNCAAVPDTLLESELFGHEKGAFTGATETRRGRFELADGGTLFLDEIGDSLLRCR